MCKLAYLGIILKADWNVLGVHNKLFYCSTILETSFPPPPLLKTRTNGIEFWLSLCFTLDLGGWGFDIPFYFVQDCCFNW